MNEISVNIPLASARAALDALTKMPWEFAHQHIVIIEQRHNAAVEAANAANAAKQAATAPQEPDAPEAPNGEADRT